MGVVEDSEGELGSHTRDKTSGHYLSVVFRICCSARVLPPETVSERLDRSANRPQQSVICITGAIQARTYHH